jgi:uncharacterized protein
MSRSRGQPHLGAVRRRRAPGALRRRSCAVFWQQARASGRVQFVREVDLAIQRIFRPDEIDARNIQVEPLGMLNVDRHGNVSSFSPELLGLSNPAYGDYLLGNIHRDSLPTIYANCLDSALLRDIRAGVEACSASCDYFSVCGGGAPVNKLYENGSFASTRTAFCALTQMVPTDLILEAYERLEQDASLADTSTAAAAAGFLGTLPASRTP